MNYTNERRNGELRKAICHALIILPAVALGALAMIHGGVSPALWGQQLAAWAIFALLIWPLQRACRRIPAQAWCVLLVIPLAAALLGEGAGGARRWIDLGVFNVHAAQLVLPALLVALCRVKCPYPVLLGAAVILCVQPSAAQLAAFSAAAIPIIFQSEKKLWSWCCLLILGVLTAVSARMPVMLEPVSYCEGILGMLGDMSWLLLAAGWAALALVPAGFLVCFLRSRRMTALCLSVYYATTLLLVLTGECPVLFMGFGLSPIAGYDLALLCDAATACGKN